MTAHIATLEGDYTRGYKYTGRRYQDSRLQGETMSGFWGAIGKMGKSAFQVVIAPVKGITHATLELGRGVMTGDIKRILNAPIKGTGHIFGEAYRGTKTHLEYYWRPSKMSQWMGPAGAGLSAAAPFTGPAAPFLLAGGAALTLGGAVGSKIYETGLERKAARAGNTPEAIAARLRAEKEAKNRKIWMYAGGAALIGGIALIAL